MNSKLPHHGNLHQFHSRPLTTRVKHYKGNPILQPSETNGLTRQSELLVFHIRSISKDRLVKKIGTIPSSAINQTIKTLNDILKY